jgi:hypothetical protein
MPHRHPGGREAPSAAHTVPKHTSRPNPLNAIKALAFPRQLIARFKFGSYSVEITIPAGHYHKAVLCSRLVVFSWVADFREAKSTLQELVL